MPTDIAAIANQYEELARGESIYLYLALKSLKGDASVRDRVIFFVYTATRAFTDRRQINSPWKDETEAHVASESRS